MKYLINNSFKAIRQGAFVVASEKEGEFIFDTNEEDSHSAATLHEIAKKNGIEIGSRVKKHELISQLDEHLQTLKLMEQNKMTETQIVEEIVVAGFAAGKNDNDMMIEILTKGVGFKTAVKLFKAVVEEKGLRVSQKDRFEKATSMLEGFLPTTYSDVTEKALEIANGIEDTDLKQAFLILKKWSKANGMELPKKEKGKAGREAGESGFRSVAYDWMINNPEGTDEQLSILMEKNGKKPSSMSSYFVWFKFAKKFHAALSA